MVKRKIIKQIKRDFNFLKADHRVLGIFLYGSHVFDDDNERSDIDICIVAGKNNIYDIYCYIVEHLEVYDIRFFEELPLYIQGEIIDNGVLIDSLDEPALHEYLFHFRKRWVDQKFRLKRLLIIP
ncbi:MAG: nucleotidyltransferase family protein [Promethearchaeota archaeon]